MLTKKFSDETRPAQPSESWKCCEQAALLRATHISPTTLICTLAPLAQSLVRHLTMLRQAARRLPTAFLYATDHKSRRTRSHSLITSMRRATHPATDLNRPVGLSFNLQVTLRVHHVSVLCTPDWTPQSFW